jgi:hypothetical protein
VTRTKRRILIAAGIATLVGIVAVTIAAHRLAKRFDPYIREQAVVYLEKRFDSEVEIGSLKISIPKLSAANLVFRRGGGTFARVEGERISLRHRRNLDLPPMFVMKKFSCLVDLGTVLTDHRKVRSVVVDGMEITIPPAGRRPDLHTESGNNPDTGVVIDDVVITDSMLRILPKDADKDPLRFDLHRIHLQSTGPKSAMAYEATLTNATPPGEIQSKGSFGPWAAEEPGDTPLQGGYQFENADLGVFDGIAGILHSTGDFEGALDSIAVKGEASVPDFRLKVAGHRVPLTTRFDVLVDGTNGNTVLKPVFGRLGTTEFKTSGGVIKNESASKRTINLEVLMPNGNMRDLLTLAMKDPPFMEGRIRLSTKILIPPLKGRVRQKLILDGHFEIREATFLRSKIQQQIDILSRRGQGDPKNEEIVQVPSGLAGSFNLANELLTFRALSFAVPGAGVDLAGTYNLKSDDIDFHGALKLQAKVSQTMTGWKRWVLKPVDPFFAKEGAGTLLHIQVTGTSKDPHFGLDHRKKTDDESTSLHTKPQ